MSAPLGVAFWQSPTGPPEEEDVPPPDDDDPAPPEEEEEEEPPPPQSESLAREQPDGQQPSPPVHMVMSRCPQARLQDAAAPVVTSCVQAFPSSQVVGQLPSHVSPSSRVLFPHVALQSLSWARVHPAGQHPSLLRHTTMGWNTHAAEQLLALPPTVSMVHAM